MNIQPILITIILGMLAGIGGYFYGDGNGYARREAEDAKALLAAKDRESKLIEQVRANELTRQSVTIERVAVVHDVRDDSGCLDLDLRNTFPNVVGVVRDSANSK